MRAPRRPCPRGLRSATRLRPPRRVACRHAATPRACGTPSRGNAAGRHGSAMRRLHAHPPLRVVRACHPERFPGNTRPGDNRSSSPIVCRPRYPTAPCVSSLLPTPFPSAPRACGMPSRGNAAGRHGNAMRRLHAHPPLRGVRACHPDRWRAKGDSPIFADFAAKIGTVPGRVACRHAAPPRVGMAAQCVASMLTRRCAS